MTEEFIITLSYKREVQHFTAKLLLQGYGHRFEVDVYGIQVFFEPGEDGCYRVIKMPWQEEKDLLSIDKTLLAAIAGKIEDILA